MKGSWNAGARRRAQRLTRSEAGFSLIELGIVIAVIAVLAGVVITGAGFIRAAKERSAVDLILTIQKAARQFAMRHQNGLAYGGSLEPGRNISMDFLRAQNFLPSDMSTPWGKLNEAFTVVAVNLPAAQCAGFTCMRIEMEVPPEQCAPPAPGVNPYLIQELSSKAVQLPVCAGPALAPRLQVVMR